VAGLQTEFEFTLPKGFVGSNGELHRVGTMRLATARDEIEPLRDRSIDGPDDPYLTILVLARVITSLGSLPEVGVTEVEGLFAADLAFLQDLYGIINFGDQADVEALQASVLPDPETAAPTSVGDQADVVDDGAGEISPGDLGDRSDGETAVEDAPRRRGRVEEVTSVSTS
jgi:hypothetical protein